MRSLVTAVAALILSFTMIGCSANAHLLVDSKPSSGTTPTHLGETAGLVPATQEAPKEIPAQAIKKGDVGLTDTAFATDMANTKPLSGSDEDLFDSYCTMPNNIKVVVMGKNDELGILLKTEQSRNIDLSSEEDKTAKVCPAGTLFFSTASDVVQYKTNWENREKKRKTVEAVLKEQ